MGCWTSYQSGGDYGMYNINYTLNGAPDLPQLSVPDYIIRVLSVGRSTPYGFGYQTTLLNAMAQARWGDFCTPPSPSPFNPISNDPKILDIARGIAGTFDFSRGHVIACKFTPTAKCLPYVVLHDIVSLSPGTKSIIEIRENDPATNLPKGEPGDNNVLARRIVVIPVRRFVDAGGNWTTWIETYNYGVPINAILNAIDVPHWIVIYSDDFACSDAFLGGTYKRLKFSTATTADNNVAIWAQRGAAACSWQIEPSIKSIAFATYKTGTCNGVVNITDFAFAEVIPIPAFVNDNCFGTWDSMQGKNVAVGIDFEIPRHYQKIRFSFIYKKPDGRYGTKLYDMEDVSMGSHRIFVDTGELYFQGVYTELAVTAVVMQV